MAHEKDEKKLRVKKMVREKKGMSKVCNVKALTKLAPDAQKNAGAKFGRIILLIEFSFCNCTI